MIYNLISLGRVAENESGFGFVEGEDKGESRENQAQ